MMIRQSLNQSRKIAHNGVATLSKRGFHNTRKALLFRRGQPHHPNDNFHVTPQQPQSRRSLWADPSSYWPRSNTPALSLFDTNPWHRHGGWGWWGRGLNRLLEDMQRLEREVLQGFGKSEAASKDVSTPSNPSAGNAATSGSVSATTDAKAEAINHATASTTTPAIKDNSRLRNYSSFWDRQRLFNNPDNFGFQTNLDVMERPDATEVIMDLPGVKASEVKIELQHGRHLTISGERKHDAQGEKDGSRWIERSSGSFSRSVTLGENVDVDKISAKHENGVLRITLPKRPEVKPKVTRISIESADTTATSATTSGATGKVDVTTESQAKN